MTREPGNCFASSSAKESAAMTSPGSPPTPSSVDSDARGIDVAGVPDGADALGRTVSLVVAPRAVCTTKSMVTG